MYVLSILNTYLLLCLDSRHKEFGVHMHICICKNPDTMDILRVVKYAVKSFENCTSVFQKIAIG